MMQQFTCAVNFWLVTAKDNLKIVIDRTNWKFGQQDINIFMLGIAYRDVAFPLMITMKNKMRNSNSAERIALTQRFIKLFGKDCIDCIVADREFVGDQWIGYLNREDLKYYIRITINFKVILLSNTESIPANWLLSI